MNYLTNAVKCTRLGHIDMGYSVEKDGIRFYVEDTGSGIPQELQDRLHNCAEAAFHLDQEMSTIREEITNAQRLNEIRRKMTSNILDNIRKLHFMLNLEDMSAINKEFSDVWNSNDIDKLREFNERLNVLVEVYRI